VVVVELVMLMVVADVVLVVVVVMEVPVWLVVEVRLLLLLLLLLVFVSLIVTSVVGTRTVATLVVVVIVIGLVVCVDDAVVTFADSTRSKVSTRVGHFTSFWMVGTQGQRTAAARKPQQHTTTTMQHCSGLFKSARKRAYLGVLVPKCMIGLS